MADLKRVEDLVRYERLVSPTASTRDLVRSLRLWWCLKYSRPFKDPLLMAYTLEELFYEYMTHHFLNPENDPVKKKKNEAIAQDDAEWVKQQMASMGHSGEPPPDPPLLGENIGELPPNLPEFSTKFED